MFSDRFAEHFAHLVNVAGWVGLDTGKAGINQLFWEVVQEAFAVQDEGHNDNFFTNDEVLNDIYHINPGKVAL